MIHASLVEEGVTACMHKSDSLLRLHRHREAHVPPRAAECKSRKPRENPVFLLSSSSSQSSDNRPTSAGNWFAKFVQTRTHVQILATNAIHGKVLWNCQTS